MKARWMKMMLTCIMRRNNQGYFNETICIEIENGAQLQYIIKKKTEKDGFLFRIPMQVQIHRLHKL